MHCGAFLLRLVIQYKCATQQKLNKTIEAGPNIYCFLLLHNFNKMPTRFFYILICLFLTTYAVGQDYNYQHYDLGNGLSGLTVYSIAQDNNGYLWFGTETGLSRFDGAIFRYYTTAD